MGLVDASGERTHTYDYGPTGLPRTTPTESLPQSYRFTGIYFDPTGLYKMGARYYDPHLGRFTQPDPSGQETNPYLYAAGDPVNRIDPAGLYSIDDFKSDVGFVGSTATIGGVIGGGVGSVVPGVGTGVGTVVGGVAGVYFGVGVLVGEALGS
ncbi:RHS repeat-associated core domain-containing protein [Streptomyces desertarenae]|uniref:RHS repeat-associated core domain-containing protein n=1 Tax=Streptomyces desertarenae TaxID=2666184 RepID=A0ABW4PJA4_9ACTN